MLYKRAPRLFADLATARGEGRLLRMLANIERTRLLIIDDWGPEPLTAEQRRDLLEIVDDRYDKGSLLITSQVPVSRWHEVIGDGRRARHRQAGLMREGPLTGSDETLPGLRRDLLQPPDPARLEPIARAQHPPRILLL